MLPGVFPTSPRAFRSRPVLYVWRRRRSLRTIARGRSTHHETKRPVLMREVGCWQTAMRRYASSSVTC